MQDWRLAVICVAGIACFYGVLTALSYLVDKSKAKKAAAKKEKQFQERLRQFRSDTLLCPHCLGSGRVPKPDFEWTDEAIDQFIKQRREEEIPESIRKAFKE